MGAPHGPATPRWPSPFHPVHDLHASIERKRVTMNDPHVVALVYRIEYGPDIDWSQAGIVRLIRLDLKNLQSRPIRLQVDATRPGRRLGLV